jgi:glycine cleavage system H protein
MNVPDDREYTTSHEWIQLDGESALVGLTAGNPSLAEIVQVRLPVVGRAVKAGDEAAAVISRGTEQSVRAPLSGSIIETNSALEADPTLLARHPYGTGWLFRLDVEAGEEIEHLLDPAAYRDFLQAAESIEVP